MARVLPTASTGLAVALALTATAIGIRWNTFAAGGSDSHCYLQQGRLFSEGAVRLREPLAVDARWPAADLTFAPAGFAPSPRERGASVPICPPGLSLVMAPFIRFGTPFLVVPMLGGLAVWCTFVLAARMAGSVVGWIAAGLLACSPIFLFQLVQPMSDVPATAWWLATLVAVSRGTIIGEVVGGGAAGLAVLTRPNLSPLAVVVAVALMRRGSMDSPRESAPRPGSGGFGWVRTGVRRAGPFACGLLPGVAALLLLQQAVHGAPFRTGYGDPTALFAWAHVTPNLQRYLGWLWETHGPLLPLAVFGPFAAAAASSPAGQGVAPRWLAFLCGAMATTTFALYLPYLVFDDWSYLRFLLPSLPLLIVLAVIGLRRLMGRLPRRLGTPALIALVVAAGVWWTQVAVDRAAFRLQKLERHFIDAGHIAARLPAEAVVVTVLDSGSVRFHGGRPTVLWESLAPDQFDRALDDLRRRGRRPYLLIEASEMDAFRARFRGYSALAELDWPPAIQVDRSIRLFDPAERTRFLADGRVRTEHFRSPVSRTSDWR